MSEYTSQRARWLRTQIIGLLGDRCINCGFDDIRALQIDHIHGGGKKEIAGMHYYAYLEKVLDELHLNKYQVLCANCNWIKRQHFNEII